MRPRCPGCQRQVGLTAAGEFTFHYEYAPGLGGHCPLSGKAPHDPLRAICLACKGEVETSVTGRATFHREPQAALTCPGTNRLPALMP